MKKILFTQWFGGVFCVATLTLQFAIGFETGQGKDDQWAIAFLLGPLTIGFAKIKREAVA